MRELVCNPGRRAIDSEELLRGSDMIRTTHKAPNVLTVDLTRRLPDVDCIDQVPPDIERFGRFALLHNGALWFGELNTSHPPTTENGFYWAISENRLYISPRGSTYRWTSHITDDVVREVARRAGLRRWYKWYRLIEE